MKEIIFPNNLDDLKNTSYEVHICNPFDPEDSSDYLVHTKIDGLSEIEVEQSSSEELQEILDTIYSLVTKFNILSSENKNYFASVYNNFIGKLIKNNFDSLTTTVKNYIKLYLFLYQHFAKIAEQYFQKLPTSIVDKTIETQKNKGKKATKGDKLQKNNDTEFIWIPHRITILQLFHDILSIDSTKLWSLGIIHESFLTILWEYPLYLLEKRPAGLNGHSHSETNIRTQCVELISMVTKYFGNNQTCGSYASLSTAMINTLMSAEYMPQYIADICQLSHTHLVHEILSELTQPHIAKMPSVKNIGTFIELFTKVNPILMMKNLPVIYNQIDSPAHQIRSSVVTAMGYIISYIHQNSTTITANQDEDNNKESVSKDGDQTKNTDEEDKEEEEEDDVEDIENTLLNASSNDNEDDDDDDEEDEEEDNPKRSRKQKKKNSGNTSNSSSKSNTIESKKKDSLVLNTTTMTRVRDNIVDILIERTHDKNYYTRANILKTWNYMLDMNSIPVRHMSTICEIAIDRLQDKTAIVRKQAISLLSSLLENNPYGSHLNYSHYSTTVYQLECALKNRIDILKTNSVTYQASHMALLAEEALENETADKENAMISIIHKKIKHKKTNLSMIIEENEEDSDEYEDDDEEKDENNENNVVDTTKDESSNYKKLQLQENKQLRNKMAEEQDKMFLVSEEVVGDSEIIELKSKLECMYHACRFIELIIKAMKYIEDMLFSKTSSDVIETLQFITCTVKFGIDGASAMLRKAFTLVWHPESTIKQECLHAFSRVYLTDGSIISTPQLLTIDQMSTNLIQLNIECIEKDNEITSLEQIIAELFQQDVFSSIQLQVLDCIWEIIQKENMRRIHSYQQLRRLSSNTRKSTRGSTMTSSPPPPLLGAALRAIAMIVKLSPTTLTIERLKILEKVAFNSHVFEEHDFVTLRAACICLQMSSSFYHLSDILSETSVQTSKKDKIIETRQELRQVLTSFTPALRTILIGDFCCDTEQNARKWLTLAEEAMHALFHTCPYPDQVMYTIIAYLYQYLAMNEGKSLLGGVHGVTSTIQSAETNHANQIKLARLFFILGQTSLCTLAFTEKIATINKKMTEYKHMEESNMKNSSTAKKESNSTHKNKHTKKSTKDNKKHDADNYDNNDSEEEEDNEEGAMEEEMGLAASADADYEMKYNYIVEHEIVTKNVLGKFHPLIAFIVANDSNAFSHPLLRETAILALCRYMCVSQTICETYLPLLFTTLEKEVSSPIRTTMMIALGDMAFRFPNTLEPWNAYLYMRLNDADVIVRYNTLTVLTHLILNDMIKVKGQVSHVVLCLNDTNETIRELAATFFTKLSERSNNPVYNLLGDIIATLSCDSTTAVGSEKSYSKKTTTTTNDDDDDDSNLILPTVLTMLSTTNTTCTATSAAAVTKSLTTEEFQKIMQFMLSFVKKDIQGNSLLERLLVRLSMATTLSQQRRLGYCISQLKINEKGVKKIIESFKYIKDAMYDEEIRNYIMTVTKSVKRSFKHGTDSTTTTTKATGVSGSEDMIHDDMLIESLSTHIDTTTNSGNDGNKSTINTLEIKSIMAEFDSLIEQVSKHASGHTIEDDEDDEEDNDDDNVATRGQNDTKRIEESNKIKEKVTSKTVTKTAPSRSTRGKTVTSTATTGKKLPPKKSRKQSYRDEDEEEDDDEDEEDDDKSDTNDSDSANDNEDDDEEDEENTPPTINTSNRTRTTTKTVTTKTQKVAISTIKNTKTSTSKTSNTRSTSSNNDNINVIKTSKLKKVGKSKAKYTEENDDDDDSDDGLFNE